MSYSYDKNNRKTEVIDAEKQVTQYEYDAIGNTLSTLQPQNTVTYSYNLKGLPKKVKYQLDDGTFMENNLTYDAIGNILEEDRKGSTPEINKNVTYTYDPLGQLLSCKEGNVKESYEYDVLGNRITKQLNDNQTASYFYNELNQLTSRMENDVKYNYTYDKRGNLTEERNNDSLVKNYFYDSTNHMTIGINIESGEQTEYIYNGLSKRVKNIQTRKSRKNDYISYAGMPEGGSSQGAYQKREISYVSDYLSSSNNDLIAYEKDYGTTRFTYGRGYERLSQSIATESNTMESARATIASTIIGKTYFQSDLLGSVLFASNNQGEVLQYADRNASGELNRSEYENLNIAGLKNSIRFTNYDYDAILDKHFAQARFYDAKQGRMLAKDPVKRGLNAYPYCKNNSVKYVDPTGKIAQIAIAALAGAGLGAIFEAAGSIYSQYKEDGKIDIKEVLGASVDGLVKGATEAALISSGVGLPLAYLGNLAAGTAGNALEQVIGTGNVDFGRSVTEGLINATSASIYGKDPLTSFAKALVKGTEAGAATSGIRYLSEVWNDQNIAQNVTRGSMKPLSYINQRNRNNGSQKSNPFNGELGYQSGTGYQYGTTETNQANQGGFSFVDLAKEMALGAVVGGLESLSLYGLDKVFNFTKDRISSTRAAKSVGNKGGSKNINPNEIRFSQSSVNGAKDITASMKTKGWVGDPIDVVKMPDVKLTTIDNTRVLAARNAGIDVKANVHAANEPISSELAVRFKPKNGQVPNTWGEAVTNRINNQNAGYRTTYPSGSNITGWDGN